MSNAIQVELKSVYGRDMIYPVCPKAKLFAALVMQKTLTEREIDLIKKIGFEAHVTNSVPAKL